MKKLIALLALAAVAFTASARTFTIGLGNGDIKLDRKYLQYGSADLIGIECITANDTGDVTLAVGKHMEAQQKVITYTEVYETNIVHVTDYFETNRVWTGTETFSTNNFSTTNPYGEGDFFGDSNPIVLTASDFAPGNQSFEGWAAHFPHPAGYKMYLNDYYNGTVRLMAWFGSGFLGKFNERYEVTTNLVNANELDFYNETTVQYDFGYGNKPYRTNRYHLHLTASEGTEHWHLQTNVVHVGTITNVSWKAVNRTCYQNAINTNLTDGIIIHYLENPIRLFRNDYIRSTCPIEDQTNPGIYHAIMKDEGAASIIL